MSIEAKFGISTISLSPTNPRELLFDYSKGVINNAYYVRNQFEKAGIDKKDFYVSTHVGLVGRPLLALALEDEGFPSHHIDMPEVTNWIHEASVTKEDYHNLPNQIGWNLLQTPHSFIQKKFTERAVRNITEWGQFEDRPFKPLLRLNSQIFKKGNQEWEKIYQNPEFREVEFAIEQSPEQTFSEYIGLMQRLNSQYTRVTISFDGGHTLEAIDKDVRSPETVLGNFEKICAGSLFDMLSLVEIDQVKRVNGKLSTHESLANGLIGYPIISLIHRERIEKEIAAGHKFRMPQYVLEIHPKEIDNLQKEENVNELSKIVTNLKG